MNTEVDESNFFCHETGIRGEQIAADYLITNGFQIIARNWRHKHWEIDIIAIRDNILRIVEVKTRKKDGLTSPQEAMTRTKFNFLCKAARCFLATSSIDMEVEFDLIAVHLDATSHTIDYIPNVMTPRW